MENMGNASRVCSGIVVAYTLRPFLSQDQT